MNALFRRFARDDRGATLVFVAISMPLIMLLLAMVIDLDIGRLTKNRLQIAADSGALAGAARLPSLSNARTEAIAYALRNYPEDLSGAPVVAPSDVEFGNWTGGAFLPNVAPLNAIRVTARRDDVAGNPLQAMFAAFAGIETFEIEASSVAVVSTTRAACQGGGILSGERIPLPFFSPPGSFNTFGSGFCLYGVDGVQIGDRNTISEDAVIAMQDKADFAEGVNNDWHEKDAQLQSADWGRPFVDLVDSVQALIQDGVIPEAVPLVISTEVTLGGGPGPGHAFTRYEFEPEDGTLYIVDGEVRIPSGTDASGFAIFATHDIDIESNVHIRDAVLVTADDIMADENVTFGTVDACDRGYFNTYLFADDDVRLGTNLTLMGVQITAEDYLDIEGGSTESWGFYAETGGAASFGDDIDFRTCDAPLSSAYGEIPNRSELTGSLALVK